MSIMIFKTQFLNTFNTSFRLHLHNYFQTPEAYSYLVSPQYLYIVS